MGPFKHVEALLFDLLDDVKHLISGQDRLHNFRKSLLLVKRSAIVDVKKCYLLHVGSSLWCHTFHDSLFIIKRKNIQHCFESRTRIEVCARSAEQYSQIPMYRLVKDKTFCDCQETLKVRRSAFNRTLCARGWRSILTKVNAKRIGDF